MATKNTTAPRLEVKGIRKTFGQNAVLKGINLSVDAGEVVALMVALVLYNKRAKKRFAFSEPVQDE